MNDPATGLHALRRLVPPVLSLCVLLPPAAAPAQVLPAEQPAGQSQVLSSLQSPALHGVHLGMIQEAWDDPEAHRAPDQASPGYKLYRYAWNAVYRLNIRVDTTASLRLDPSESIANNFLAAPYLFEVRAVPPNALEIRPLHAGGDTTLAVYTRSGRLYKFYLRSLDADAATIPDVLADVLLARTPVQSPGSAGGPHQARPAADGAQTTVQGTPATDFSAPDALARLNAGGLHPRPQGIYGNLAQHGADITALRYDLRAYGSSPEAVAAIGPERVFRDNRWTYVDFGPRSASMNAWPTASLLAAGTETPVASRIAGPDRNVLIVEAIGSVVLRSGPHVICIELVGTPSGPPPASPRQAAPARAVIQGAPPDPGAGAVRVSVLFHADDAASLRQHLPAALRNVPDVVPDIRGDSASIESLPYPTALAICATLSPSGIRCTFRTL